MAISKHLIQMIRYIQNNYEPPVISDTNYIYDQHNRIFVFHGVNISNYQKHSPGHEMWPEILDLLKLRRWGFSLVRYLVFWSEIEPTDGVYNDAYIDQVTSDLNSMRNSGIYTVVDFHQDLMAERFTGNGFPDWSVDQRIKITIPFIGDIYKTVPFITPAWDPWSRNYLQPAVLTAFRNFWKSSSKKTKYLDAVQYTMNRIESTIPSTPPTLMGFDVMNEPFPGTTTSFESKVLTDFYADMWTRLNASALYSNMFYEPWMSTSSGLPSFLKFKPNSQRSVYFPHYYDVLVHEGRPYKWYNRNIMEQAIKIKVEEAKKFGSPLVFGEFGAPPAVDGYLNYVGDFVNLADKYKCGWCYWSYDKYSNNNFGMLDDLGNPKPVMDKLVRVYPRNIAGANPTWGIVGKKFTLVYDSLPIAAPTNIYIPPDFTGVTVTANGITTQWTGYPPYEIYFHANDMQYPQQEIIVRWD